MKKSDPLALAREICLAQPEATEKIAWGEPTWRVRDKIFATFDNHHHGAEHVSLWCNATPDAQQSLVASKPEHFFVPPYVGGKGWVGMNLDTGLDREEIAAIVAEAWRRTAPKTLLKKYTRDATERYETTLLSGHKGFAFELPFDPAQRWGAKMVHFRHGRNGYPVEAMLNGIPFDSYAVPRLNRLWVLVEEDLAKAAGVSAGDTIKVAVGAPASALAEPAASRRR